MTARVLVEHRLAHVDDIPPGEGREFCVGGRRVAVFRRRDGGLSALDAACPHRGGPLADGIVGMGLVVCPLHGRAFALDSGEAVEPGGEGVAAYPVRRGEDGSVLLSLPA